MSSVIFQDATDVAAIDNIRRESRVFRKLEERLWSKFSAAAAGTAVVFGLSFAAATQANGQSVTIEHPAGVVALGGQQYRTLDCNSLEKLDGKLWLTCEAAEQIDSNGQEICNVTDNLSADPAKRKNQLSIALYQALVHFGRVHKDCIAQAGSVDQRLGHDPDKIYGAGWQSRSSCTLVQARDQCSSALGLGKD